MERAGRGNFGQGFGSGSNDPGHRPSEITALLGRGTRFEGKLFFEGRVRIDGSFRGEIRGEDVLVIGEGANVSGQVLVSSCIVTGGEVTADIKARDAIELYAPAKVTGALHAPAIFIDRGVVFDGTCKMAPLDAADQEGAPPGSPEPTGAPSGGDVDDEATQTEAPPTLGNRTKT